MQRHRIDKAALRETIASLEGLTNEQKADLLQLLSEQKRYGLVWEDHAEDVEEQLRTQLPILSEVKDKQIISPPSEGAGEVVNHILIEGDNLHALTALTYTHEGCVDVIYIDPPYNTGNKDFVYNDSFVDSEDGYRHSKWLSFMHKRVKIAKRLLSDRGVIFISIDDNEQANLKLLCDEVFGANNYLSSFPRKGSGGRQDSKYFAIVHEYVLVYAKNLEHYEAGRSKKTSSSFKLYDNEKKKYYKTQLLRKWGDGSKREDRPNLFYPIFYTPEDKSYSLEEKSPNAIAIYPMIDSLTEGRWRWGKSTMEEGIRNNVIELQEKKGDYILYERVYEDAVDSTKPYSTWIDDIDNSTGSSLLKDILKEELFGYPKPVDLIQKILCMSTPCKDSLILDFFAGSGTTLHATMQLNAEDGGHRQCILVTNNENGICENVTYERNRRVIQGYTTPKGVEVMGLSRNNLRYYRTDFVERETTRTAKRQLMMASTELLCIKHDVYDEQRSFGHITLRPTIARYFADGKQQMLIVYRTEAIESLVAEITQMPESTRILVYVFSTNNYAMDADFEEVSDKVTLCALPAAIYNAYLQVLPKRRMPKDENENHGGTQA